MDQFSAACETSSDSLPANQRSAVLDISSRKMECPLATINRSEIACVIFGSSATRDSSETFYDTFS